VVIGDPHDQPALALHQLRHTIRTYHATAPPPREGPN
jgi:hypothetical protein